MVRSMTATTTMTRSANPMCNPCDELFNGLYKISNKILFGSVVSYLLSRTIINVSACDITSVQGPILRVRVHLVGEYPVELVDDPLRRDADKRLALREERPDDREKSPPVVPQRDGVVALAVVRPVRKFSVCLKHLKCCLCAFFQFAPVNFNPVICTERVSPFNCFNK